VLPRQLEEQHAGAVVTPRRLAEVGCQLAHRHEIAALLRRDTAHHEQTLPHLHGQRRCDCTLGGAPCVVPAAELCGGFGFEKRCESIETGGCRGALQGRERRFGSAGTCLHSRPQHGFLSRVEAARPAIQLGDDLGIATETRGDAQPSAPAIGIFGSERIGVQGAVGEIELGLRLEDDGGIRVRGPAPNPRRDARREAPAASRRRRGSQPRRARRASVFPRCDAHVP
jgi:hypothetical protein